MRASPARFEPLNACLPFQSLNYNPNSSPALAILLTGISLADQCFLQSLQPAAHGAVIHRRADPHHRAAENGLIERELRFNSCARQFADALEQRIPFVAAQLARCHDFRLPNAHALLQLSAICGCNVMHVGNAIVVDEHGKQVPKFLLEAHPGVQLVEDRYFLFGCDRGICEKRAQLRAAVPGGKKVTQLAVDGRRIKMRGSHDVEKRAGVAGGECGHQFFPPLAVSFMNSAISARSVSGVSTSCLDACSMARSAAKLRSPRWAWAAAAAISCSAAATMRLVSSSMEDLIRCSSFLPSASTWARIAAISWSNFESFSSTALMRAFASSVIFRAASMSCFKAWARPRSNLGKNL